jgi:hypothetical protein
MEVNMRLILLAMVVFACMACIAKTVETPTSSTAPTGSFNIEDTKSFFISYTAKITPPERGDFETDEEYQKRLPKPWDTNKVVYFKVDYNIKNYTYDINAKKLTIHSGTFLYSDFEEYGATIPIIIHNETEDKGSYIGTNAYGAEVTVNKVYIKDYILNIVNADQCKPDYLTDPPSLEEMRAAQENTNNFITIDSPLHFTFNIEPAAAEKFCKAAQMIIGVKLLGYSNSEFKCTGTAKPTIDHPRELASFRYRIDCRLASIIVTDGKPNGMQFKHTFENAK